MGSETLTNIIIWILIGGVAGWLASIVVKGGGMGIVGNVILGIIGAFVAGWLFPQLGISIGSGIVGTIISAAIGAIIVLLLVRLIKRA